MKKIQLEYEEDIEWDVYYDGDWVGTVFAKSAREAKTAAEWEWEHEKWDPKKFSVYRSKDD